MSDEELIKKEAATIIQSIFRGYRVRRKFTSKMKHFVNIEKEQVSVKVIDEGLISRFENTKWDKKINKKGYIYYKNRNNGSYQWSFPPEAATDNEWTINVNENRETYYHCLTLNESRWTLDFIAIEEKANEMTRRIIIPKNNIPASLTFLTTTLDKKPNNSKTLEETSDDDDDENYDDDDSDSFITAYSGSPLKKITQQGMVAATSIGEMIFKASNVIMENIKQNEVAHSVIKDVKEEIGLFFSSAEKSNNDKGEKEEKKEEFIMIEEHIELVNSKSKENNIEEKIKIEKDDDMLLDTSVLEL